MSSTRTIIVSIAAALALIGTPAEAGTTYYSYDAQGRLTQKCDSRAGNGEVANYSLDSAGSRTNLSNSRTDLNLFVGDTFYSPNANFFLSMQGDSNFVLYHTTTSGWVPLWATNTVGSGTNHVYFQSDGNLVLNTAAGTPIWSSATNHSPCARLAVTDTGKVTIQRLLDRSAGAR
jgi:YD repeat-containing protein